MFNFYGKMEKLKDYIGVADYFSIFNIQSSLSLQMIAAQPPKKANWSRKTIAIQDSFLPLSL